MVSTSSPCLALFGRTGRIIANVAMVLRSSFLAACGALGGRLTGLDSLCILASNYYHHINYGPGVKPIAESV